MRALWNWLLFVGAVLLGGALLAPWLYQAGCFLARTFPGLRVLETMPFHRYVHRSLLLMALAGLWPMLRAHGLSSLEDLGLGRGRNPTGQLLRGAIGGFLLVAVVAVFEVTLGPRMWDTGRQPEAIWRHGLNASSAALLVSPIEEILFRGAMLGSMARAAGPRIALVSSSLLYALVHFFERTRWTGPVEWTTGLTVLGGMLRGLADCDTLVPAFFTLAMAGAVMGLIYQRTGALWMSMGFHAAWTFWIKTFAFATNQRPDTMQASAFWGTGKVVDGWLGLAVLVILLVILARRLLVGEGGNAARASSNPPVELAS
ncbi:MAG TPA: CPBP family intramembrane metalloprotease [Verrucomicrobiota bacterium]|nr:CPBP family intramembrane metalloprotease [Verrucomicrobiota bacterium]HNU51670.1 CPBP family intramembrane metalloprotease [Verrucomicrobiota bacterium]